MIMYRLKTATITIFILAVLAIGPIVIGVVKAQVSPETIKGFELGAGVEHPTVVPQGTTGRDTTGRDTTGRDTTSRPAADVPGYLTHLYQWFLGFVGIAALLGIVIGGVMYMFAGANITKVDAARGWITNAFVGILIAAFSYLLLKTINPDLIQGFNIQTVIEKAIQGTKK